MFIDHAVSCPMQEAFPRGGVGKPEGCVRSEDLASLGDTRGHRV